MLRAAMRQTCGRGLSRMLSRQQHRPSAATYSSVRELPNLLDRTPLPDPGEAVDTVVLPGGGGVDAARTNAELTAWIKAVAGSARRIVTVCTGAFLAAEAGLLDGCRVTTHWAFAGRLAPSSVALVMLPALFIAGMGGGSVITPNQALSLAEVDVRGGSTAGGMLQTSQRIGNAIGAAVISAVFYAVASGAPNEYEDESTAHGFCAPVLSRDCAFVPKTAGNTMWSIPLASVETAWSVKPPLPAVE